MKDTPAEKLNNTSLEAELEKELGQAVSAEMDNCDPRDLISIYENSNTVKGMVASRKQKLLDERAEKNKKRRLLAVKLGIMVCLLGLIIIFGSIAWFTMNKEVGTGGMNMSTSSMPFEIEFPGTYEGRWIDQYRTLTSQNGIWLVSENNLDNGSGTTTEELGLEPGDSGYLEFRVKPTGSENSITVDLCFTLRAIEKRKNEPEGSPLVEITETNPEVMGFLASHIMLFTDIDANGKYTGLIQNNEELERYIRNKTYSKNDSGYTKIYWIWPLHLSDIISNQSSDLIYVPSERATVISYLVANKTGFFKGITTDDDELSNDLTNLLHYGSYSVMFDKADLDIGNKVKYVILGLSAAVTTS